MRLRSSSRCQRTWGEAKDLAAEHPQRVAQLAALLDAWEEGLVEPLFGAAGK